MAVFAPVLPFTSGVQSSVVVPEVVRDLESSFLSNVRKGLNDTPYLGAARKEEIRDHIDGGGEARAVGDDLLRALIEHKLERALALFGPDRVRWSLHPASRLFEPLQSGQSRRASAEPPLPGDVLEATLDDEVVRGSAFSIVNEMTYFLGSDLQAKSMFVHDGLPALTAPSSSTTMRFGRIATLEAGLSHYLGSRAAKFCFVPGVIPSGDMIALHDVGYHGVGLPMEPVTAHEQEYDPLDLALHDAWHGTHWSVHVTPWERRAAAALFRVLESTLPACELKSVRGLMDFQLVDLLLEVRGLSGVIKDLQQGLPRRSFLAVMNRWNPASIPIR